MPSLLDIGLGKVGTNSHPIHPATVHLPIAFLLAASVLEILSYVAMTSPSFFESLTKLVAPSYASTSAIAIIYHLSLFSYASTIIGIITAIPAILTGAIEAYAILSVRGYNLQDPIVKTTAIHAGLNDLAVAGGVYLWWTRKSQEDFIPTGRNALVSGGILVLIAYAAFLGGSLVYAHGLAVQRMGKGKEEKEEKDRIANAGRKKK